MQRWPKRVGWGLMFLLALMIALISSRYFTRNPDLYFPEQRAIYLAHTGAILGHIGGGILALVLGPLQFIPQLRRKRWLGLHRWSGRLYLVGIAMGGLFGLYVAQLAYGGLPARLGFSGLALFWLVSGYNAYRTIRAGQIQAHKRWMIRNYAATFAAVMLRLWLPFLNAVGVDFTLAYQMVAWLCWVPNLLLVEWAVNQRWSLKQRRLQYG